MYKNCNPKNPQVTIFCFEIGKNFNSVYAEVITVRFRKRDSMLICIEYGCIIVHIGSTCTCNSKSDLEDLALSVL